MRKFKFYQYKPVQESPSTPKTNSKQSNGNTSESKCVPATPRIGRPDTLDTTPSPILLPREDVLQGRVTLAADQSKELVELDKEIVKLEKKITDLNNKGNDKNVDNLDEIFSLVNKKNDLLRRQMQLNIIEQEKALERANEELTKELRSLMSIDDSRKTKSQIERQQYLYEQSLALVNKRNELVHHMDVQERGIDDDNQMKATLKSVISNTATRNKLSQSGQDQNCIIQ